jgi:signal transduction histidine kinase
MNSSDLVTRLSQHRMIGTVPPDELAWLAAHGYLRHLDRGDVIARKGEPIQSLFIVLSGHIVIHVNRGTGPRKVMEWRGGDVSGLLPYSRLTTPPGDGAVYEPTDLFVVDREHFPAMIQHCPTVTAVLVHVMVDRARIFTANDLQDEKMASLGRIAAGLAHELNNPASAAARSAKLLAEAIVAIETASRELGAARLTDAQALAVNQFRASCLDAMSPSLSPLERADREDTLVAWLEDHGADTDAASTLVDTAITSDALDTLAAAVPRPLVATAVRWIAADCNSRKLAAEVERAASRIHDLVAAVKRFTFMDRHQAPEIMDLAQGLRDSVALLQHKARQKGAAVTVTVEPDLPRVRAIGSDLNQVWTNLIDNAIDAVDDSGHVTVSATRGPSGVVVRVIDNGAGIPAAIKGRIFDAFFTTKPIGQGTGLGLEIARRLVRQNDGEIEVESRPGSTEFRVTLPVADDRAPA